MGIAWLHFWMIKWALILLAIGWLVKKLWPIGCWVVAKGKDIIAKIKG